MKTALRVLAMIVPVAILIAICGFRFEPVLTAHAAMDADVIVTAAPVYEPLAGLKGGERFPKGAQLFLVHEGKAEALVSGFAASADANVSFDGTRVLFAGKQNAGDSWQIWELTLADHSLRRLIAGDGDAIRPLYLPGGRLVYARKSVQGFRLEAAGKDGHAVNEPVDAQVGETVLPLSYLPGSTIPEDVLLDGRILLEAGFPLGAGTTPEMYLVYSDGSGVESYRCDHGVARWGGRQLGSGDVVFTHGNSLARFSSPLAAEARIAAPRGEYAGGIVETALGDWLVSERAGVGTHYALKVWKSPTGKGAETRALETLLAVNGKDIVEPVVVAARTRPKRHPSGLHDWNYANMMALDARQSREGDLKSAPAQVRLEALDGAGHAVAKGTAPVEADGSFFVRVPADRPIRFALLDEKGATVRQEHGWFWIRKGEQRICVGCHAGPERASENRMPMVLTRTTTPVDLTGAGTEGSAQHVAAGSH
ncbi:MAG: hypothetical protein ABR976_18995 [Terracidiphilus sp.]